MAALVERLNQAQATGLVAIVHGRLRLAPAVFVAAIRQLVPAQLLVVATAVVTTTAQLTPPRRAADADVPLPWLLGAGGGHGHGLARVVAVAAVPAHLDEREATTVAGELAFLHHGPTAAERGSTTIPVAVR